MPISSIEIFPKPSIHSIGPGPRWRLGDYVDYYLGSSYLQSGPHGGSSGNLADFPKAHPDSLLVRDAAISYADALLLEGQPAEAVTLLEQTRIPSARTWNLPWAAPMVPQARP